MSIIWAYCYLCGWNRECRVVEYGSWGVMLECLACGGLIYITTDSTTWSIHY